METIIKSLLKKIKTKSKKQAPKPKPKTPAKVNKTAKPATNSSENTKTTLDHNNQQKKDYNMVGWDAITEACEKIYPQQTTPKHYGTLIPWALGGEHPLSGISIYDGGDYWHFVTYGLSELGEKESTNLELSGYGMEFTWKLAKSNAPDEEDELQNICGILQELAKITFTSGELFKCNEYIYSGQTQGIDIHTTSNITGLITIADPQLKTINTLNGKVEFIEFVGVTTTEILAVIEKKLTVKELYNKLGTDVTSYSRTSVI